jgi:hypothetical protein
MKYSQNYRQKKIIIDKQTCSSLPAFALGTIVTMGTFGLNFEMFIAVRPVLEMTMMHAADRFFDASDTD